MYCLMTINTFHTSFTYVADLTNLIDIKTYNNHTLRSLFNVFGNKPILDLRLKQKVSIIWVKNVVRNIPRFFISSLWLATSFSADILRSFSTSGSFSFISLATRILLCLAFQCLLGLFSPLLVGKLTLPHAFRDCNKIPFCNLGLNWFDFLLKNMRKNLRKLVSRDFSVKSLRFVDWQVTFSPISRIFSSFCNFCKLEDFCLFTKLKLRGRHKNQNWPKKKKIFLLFKKDIFCNKTV